MVWVGIGVAALSWIVESALVSAFSGGGLVRAIFTPDHRDMMARLPSTLCIVLISIYAHRVVSKRRQAERLPRAQGPGEHLQQAEEALKRSCAFNKLILDSMNDAIAVIDVRDYRIVGINRTFLKEYGLPREEEVIGKTCHEVTHRSHAVCAPPDDICPLKAAVEAGEHRVVEHVHYDEHAARLYVEVSATPIRDENGKVVQVIHVTRDITVRKKAEEERERLIHELQQAFGEIRTLTGLLPICANCKKIRDDTGYWSQIEEYVGKHADVEFSHGICPECREKLYPEYLNKKDK